MEALELAGGNCIRGSGAPCFFSMWARRTDPDAAADPASRHPNRGSNPNNRSDSGSHPGGDCNPKAHAASRHPDLGAANPATYSDASGHPHA